ncbi:hypothetical protein DY000_02013007 [Brassica cretica]|uniref:Alkane hydroxylase MAH1-like n=1 Tax=Brassica cretica TaxID=69181 RepID=A0ABQ7D8X2_BRACR|nr:hypothetical protein DY000_02013007 [Brassica cretica]
MAMIGLLEVFVAFLFFLVFKHFFLHKKSPGQPILKSWPVLGMLPGMLPHIPRIFDWTFEVLEATNLTFFFKGPWFSGTDMLFTADPRNIHHILSLNFGNYPKGPEFKKIFDVLGDGILSADLELWEDLRKSNHAIFHHPDFLKLSASSNTIKLKEGRDTTSSVLTWFFWLLSKHPHVLTKIRQEINTKFDPTYLEKLVYLHAALYETMRLYPPVPFNHKSPLKSDVLPSGHKVKAESKIVICIYALGRMRSVWGEDALDFKPERWISESGELKHEPSYKFMAFNAGPRACLGKHLALQQVTRLKQCLLSFSVSKMVLVSQSLRRCDSY